MSACICLGATEREAREERAADQQRQTQSQHANEYGSMPTCHYLIRLEAAAVAEGRILMT